MKDTIRLDQHFLINEKILKKIVDLAKINKKEIILEIGAGRGNLTKLLAKSAKKVYAIEKDKNLFFELKKLNKNIVPILGDALKMKFPKFDKIVSNIPYTISEPLIQKLIYHDFKLAVLLVSENFSNRLIGNKRTKLSLISETFFSIKLHTILSPKFFEPEPKVYSRIITLNPIKPNFKGLIFQEFLKQKDKKVKNALREAIIKSGLKFNKKITKRRARTTITNININKKVANLNLEELEKIRDYVNKCLNF